MKIRKAQKGASFRPTATIASQDATAIIRPVIVCTHRYRSTPSRMRRNAAIASWRSSRTGNSPTTLRSQPRREAMMKPR
jgi:hypothetical protein